MNKLVKILKAIQNIEKLVQKQEYYTLFSYLFHMDIPKQFQSMTLTVGAVWAPPRFLYQIASRKWKVSVLCVK